MGAGCTTSAHSTAPRDLHKRRKPMSRPS